MSAQEVITLKGIEDALGNLDYRNENALKTRLIHTLRGVYLGHGAPDSMDPIPTEDLIASLWGVRGDPESVRNRKKNLSSIKSSVNADLRRLYKEGRNPEGIVIGPENLFVISDEAKDDLLRSFRAKTEGTGSTSLAEIREVLAVMNGILSATSLHERHESGGNGDFQAIRDLVTALSEKVGVGAADLFEVAKNRESIDESDAQSDLKEQEEALEEVIEEEIDGEVLDLSEEEVPADVGAGQDAGGDASRVASGEAMEGFLEGAEVEDLEMVEGEEDLDEIEVSEMEGEDEDLPEPEVFTEAEEVLVAEDLSPGVGDGGDSEGPDPVADLAENELPAEVGEGSGQAEDEIVEEEVSEEPEELAEALDDVDVEEIDGEVLDVAEEEGAGDITVGQDTGMASPGIEAYEAVEGFPEGEQGEDPEVVDADEDLDVIEVSEMETDEEEISGPEAYTAEEEMQAPEDPFPGLGVEEFSDGVDPDEGLQEDGEVSDGPGAEIAPQFSAGDSADSTQRPVLDEGDPPSPEKAKVLAEAFNGSLAAMDRFYNQHLLIPAGEYRVGCRTPSKTERYEQRVRLEAFYIGKFPVTNALFEVFVEKTGYRTTAERCGHGTVYAGRYLRRVDERTGKATLTWSSALGSRVVQGACWYQPSGPGSNLHSKRNHPVVQVSLEDALAFAAWTGKRLPTEEEWEAASRTAQGTRYPCGEEFRPEAGNLETSYIGDTSTVDRYLAFENPYGIADALGNVQEWTSQKAGSPEGAQEERVCFIVKGGSWVSGAAVSLWSRTELDRDSHSNILGFRCVAY